MKFWKRTAAAFLAAALLSSAAAVTAMADERYRGYTEPIPGMVDVGIDAPSTRPSSMVVLCHPMGALLCEDGSILVTDTGNHLVWKITGGTDDILAGNVSKENMFRQPIGGYYDGAYRESYFEKPWALTPFLDGYAVSDTENNVVRFINTKKSDIQTAGGSGAEKLINALGTKAAFNHPTGLATDEGGNLYIADTNNDCIRRMDTNGNVTTYISGLTEPMGLYWHGGSLYIAEAGAGRVLKYTNGSTAVIADGLSNPQGVTVASDGTVYISDTGNHRVLKMAGGSMSVLIEGDPSVLASNPVSPVGLLVVGDKLLVCDNFLEQLIIIGR